MIILQAVAAIFAAGWSGPSIVRRSWVASGVAYGVVIFFVMNFVVVPLSAAGFTIKFSAAKFIENMLAMVLFGLIIAFFARDCAARAGVAASNAAD
jgi:FtsH-binding integral membrane protein